MPTPMPYNNALEDLAQIIAQETSGVTGAEPNKNDYDLADTFIDVINSDEYKIETVKRSENFPKEALPKNKN